MSELSPQPHNKVRASSRTVSPTPSAQYFHRLNAERQASELTETFYRTFVSPWVRLAVTPWSAEIFKWLHPMRASRYLLSETINPRMCGVAALAGMIAKDRRPLPSDHPFLDAELRLINQLSDSLESPRQKRDEVFERTFELLYANPSARGTKNE
jgi:hypothetical protein